MMSGVPLETCETSINFGIINSITKLHLVGISTEYSLQVGNICTAGHERVRSEQNSL